MKKYTHFEVKPWKKSWKDLFDSLKATLFYEWLRLSILVIIIITASFCWRSSLFEEKGKAEAFHVVLEFSGVFFLFLVIEHGLRKMESGLEDPKGLPIDKFLEDIGNARRSNSEIIIFDTFLETILLTQENCDNFRAQLQKVLITNLEKDDFSIKVLCLKPDSQHSRERAVDRGEEPEDYFNRMVAAKMALHGMKQEVYSKAIIAYNKKHPGNRKNTVDLKGKITVKEYDEEPPFSMYSVNNRAYISFYQIGIKSTSSRQLYAPEDSEFGQNIFKFFRLTFDQIWDRAVEID